MLPDLILFFFSADLPVAPFLTYLLFETFMWDYCLSVKLGCWEEREGRVTVGSNTGRESWQQGRRQPEQKDEAPGCSCPVPRTRISTG